MKTEEPKMQLGISECWMTFSDRFGLLSHFVWIKTILNLCSPFFICHQRRHKQIKKPCVCASARTLSNEHLFMTSPIAHFHWNLECIKRTFSTATRIACKMYLKIAERSRWICNESLYIYNDTAMVWRSWTAFSFCANETLWFDTSISYTSARRLFFFPFSGFVLLWLCSEKRGICCCCFRHVSVSIQNGQKQEKKFKTEFWRRRKTKIYGK